MSNPTPPPLPLREKIARAMFEAQSTGRTFWDGWGPDQAYAAQAHRWLPLADACLACLAAKPVSEAVEQAALDAMLALPHNDGWRERMNAAVAGGIRAWLGVK